jgi:hypothetical protein
MPFQDNDRVSSSMQNNNDLGADSAAHHRSSGNSAGLIRATVTFAGQVLAERISPSAQELKKCDAGIVAQEAAAASSREALAARFNAASERAAAAVAKISKHLGGSGPRDSFAGRPGDSWQDPESYYQSVTPATWLDRMEERLVELCTTAAWVAALSDDCENAKRQASGENERRLDLLRDIASKVKQSCFPASTRFGEWNLQRFVPEFAVAAVPGASAGKVADFQALLAQAKELGLEIEATAKTAANVADPAKAREASLAGLAVVCGMGCWIFFGVLLHNGWAGLMIGVIAAISACIARIMAPRWTLRSARTRLVWQVERLAEVLASGVASSQSLCASEEAVALGALKGSARVERQRLAERLEKGNYAIEVGLPADQGCLGDKLEEELRRKRGILDQERADILKQIASIAAACSAQPAWSATVARDWDHPCWSQWRPGQDRSLAVALGRMEAVALAAMAMADAPALPFFAPFAEGKSLALKFAAAAQRDAAAATVVNVVSRLLAANRAAGVKFTFVDPQYLGRSVEKFHRLAEHEPQLISGRCYTDERGIRQRLDELIDRIEGITRERLKDRHRDIESYNAENPDVAEAYHVLALFDFPEGFDSSSCSRLLKVLRNGPRCGVYTIIHWAAAATLPHQTSAEDFEVSCAVLEVTGERALSADPRFAGWSLRLYPEPGYDTARAIVEEIGKLAPGNIRVNVPFTSLHAAAFRDFSKLWDPVASGPDSSTANLIEVPLGPGGTTTQMLRLGIGLEHHALIVGGTGSGKSNLMHVIITGMALRYPADELEMYLVDFKGGVEFKRYATWRLPHARAVAVESEREFGISILRKLAQEMRNREDLFRAVNVNDLPSYRSLHSGGRAGEMEPMKRIVLLVDEFQDFFSGNDAIAEEAKALFDQLARKGRSAGIHVILGSQSISGALLLPSTENLINVRIVLKCSDDEARAVLGRDNGAARSLTRPGEAIYNGQGGSVEGNHRFQVSWMCPPEAVLPQIMQKAEIRDQAKGWKPAARELAIFEGNAAPALENCGPMLALLAGGPARDSPAVPQLWIGESIEIRPAIGLRLARHSGSNLLVITRDESDGSSLCIAPLVQMLAQMQSQDLQVHHFEAPAVDEPLPDVLAEARDCFDADRVQLHRGTDFLAPLADIREEVRARHADGSGAEGRILVVLQGLHRMRQFRRSGGRYDPLEEGSAAETLLRILEDGPEVGVHVVVWSDSIAAINRCYDQDIFSCFAFKIAGRLSADDSNNLLQCADAFKIDKAHRMCAGYEDRPGETIPLRPYAVPSAADLRKLLANLNH